MEKTACSAAAPWRAVMGWAWRGKNSPNEVCAYTLFGRALAASVTMIRVRTMRRPRRGPTLEGLLQKSGSVYLRRSGQPPVLSLPDGKTWNVFLSHTWKTGQDQVAVIKRHLHQLLPDATVFLDVDDLDDIDRLEEHVKRSALLLVFLSKGYFLSRNCLREVRAALADGVPLILVHESAPSHGGAELQAFKSECPVDLQGEVLGDDCLLIPWIRSRKLQDCTLVMICEAMLRAAPPRGKAPSTRFAKLAGRTSGGLVTRRGSSRDSSLGGTRPPLGGRNTTPEPARGSAERTTAERASDDEDNSQAQAPTPARPQPVAPLPAPLSPSKPRARALVAALGAAHDGRRGWGAAQL